LTISSDLLKELTLLQTLPEEVRGQLASRMTERSFARREVVFNKGDVGQALCFLIEGRLQGVDFTLDGREVGLYFVEPGNYFGEMSVLDGQPRPDFVIAVARARVLFLPAEEARQLIIRSPEITEAVLLRLTQRVRAVSAQRILLGMPNPAQRVCAQLMQLSISLPNGQVIIINAPTHQEIAIMVNTSRETVTRIFQVLQTRGVVERDGNSLKVTEVRYLEDVAEGKIEPPKAS